MTDQPYNQPGGQGGSPSSGQAPGEIEERKNLDSSFESSFRSTFWDLKTYEPEKSQRDTGDQTEAVGRARAAREAGLARGANGSGTAAGARNTIQHSGPPAGTHAPHHPWLLGSFGGKKKPQAVRSKTSVAVENSTYAAAYGLSPAAAASESPKFETAIGVGLAADRVQAEVERIRSEVDRANATGAQEKTESFADTAASEPDYTATIELPRPAAGPGAEAVHSTPPGSSPPQAAPPPVPGVPPPQAAPPPVPGGSSKPLVLGADLSSGTLPVPASAFVPPFLGADSSTDVAPHVDPGSSNDVLPHHDSLSARRERSRRPYTVSEDDDDDGVKTIRKPRLSSFIDKQISARDELPAHSQDSIEAFKPKRSKTARPALLFGGGLVLLLLVVMVISQGIISGGKTWIPFTSSSSSSLLEKQADDAIKYGAYNEAVDYLSKAIEGNPNQASFYHKRGLARLLSRKRSTFDDAMLDLDQAIKLQPDLHSAYLDRAALKTELAQFDSAVKDYDRLIAAHKDTARVYFGRGIASFGAGDLKAAERDFKKSLELQKDYPDALIALGDTYFARNEPGDRDRARQKYQKANDKQAVGLRNQAILLVLDNKFEDARKKYTEAIDVNPGDANLYNERGLVRIKLNDELGAADDFSAARRRDPQLDSARRNLEHVSKSLIDRGLAEIKQKKNDFHGYYLVGLALSKLGRDKDAIYYLNAAVNRKPNFPYGFELLGTCYKELGLYDEAIAPLTVGIEKNPNSSAACAARSWAYYKANKDDLALADAMKAIKLNDKEIDPYIVLSGLSRARGDYEKALEYSDRVIKLEPKSATHYSNRALIYISLKKYDSAEQDFRKSLAIDPGHWHGYRELGRMMRDRGRYEEALRHMTRAIELEPGQETYPARIDFYELSRDYDKAISDCDELISKNPYNPTNFIDRGFAELLDGRYAAAQKDYDRAIEMKEDDISYASRGEYFMRRAMFDKADADFQKALSLDPRSELALIKSVASNILQKKWDEAITVSHRLIDVEGWDEASSYNATIRRWICDNYAKRPGVALVALKTANEKAGNFPWPTPIIRFLLGEIDAEQLKKEAVTIWDVTDARFYIGMKAMFDKNEALARNELNWVIEKGTVPADEYLFAQQAIQMMDKKEVR